MNSFFEYYYKCVKKSVKTNLLNLFKNFLLNIVLIINIHAQLIKYNILYEFNIEKFI
jgi:hypothetical protein